MIATETPTDGRLLRTTVTRAKLIAAWLDYYAGGITEPSTNQLARAAGVGTRAVHRAFSSISALYLAGQDARMRQLGIVDRSQLDIYILRLCNELRRKVDTLTSQAGNELSGAANVVKVAAAEIADVCRLRDWWAS